MENIHGNAIRIKTINIELITQQIEELLKNSPHDNLHIEITGQIFKDDEKNTEYQLLLQLCTNGKVLS